MLVAALVFAAWSPALARAEGAVEPAKPPGLYGGVTLGMGQPLGGTTVSGSAAIEGGFGALGHVGYGFHPNFGVNAFFHYNSTHLAFSDRVSEKPDSSGRIMLYGVEARAMVTSDKTHAWLSAGLAMGSGQIKTTQTRSGVGYSSTREETLSVDVTVSPQLAFGAEYRLTPNLALGPQFRWYVTGFDKACAKSKGTETTSFGGAPTTSEYTSDDCAASTSKEVVPHIGFVGLGLTYYQL